MSLAIESRDVTAVLLADGWHEVERVEHFLDTWGQCCGGLNESLRVGG